MPYVMYEIRVTKVTVPLIGTQTLETVYLARPETEPDPGPIIATFNPTLVLPLPPPPPPILLEGQAGVEASANADPGSGGQAVEGSSRKSWWRG